MESLYHTIAKIELSNDHAAICTVVKSEGSTPRKAGAKMVVWENGRIAGTIGGGALEMKVIDDARQVIKSRSARLFEHALVHDHDMCCGGTLLIFIEPIMNLKRLYIFGAGHIGKALSKFARDLNFGVTLIDEREDTFDGLLAGDIKILNKNHLLALNDLHFDENTYIAVITHNHAYDREIVAYCAKQPYAYLGMIGSERKVAMAKKTFLDGQYLTEAEMQPIDWPMGIDIMVQTPEEIAIAILARLIDIRNKNNATLQGG